MHFEFSVPLYEHYLRLIHLNKKTESDILSVDFNSAFQPHFDMLFSLWHHQNHTT